MSDPIEIETIGATRIVRLNRPQARNALTLETLRALDDAMSEASSSSTSRCVVLCGAGEHFCAGADLRALLGPAVSSRGGREIASSAEEPNASVSTDRLDAAMDLFHGALKSVVRCSKPTIAMMDGAAVGFGADLAFACDLRVASTRAYAQEKFVHLGLIPDGGGTFWLPRLLGTAKAMEVIMLAQRLEAADLSRLGIVTSIVEPERLLGATLDLARRIEGGPPLAFAALKRALYASLGPLEDALRREREEQLKLLRTRDFAEGVAAWTERRSPRFEGR